jgi:hypothetical protein
VSYGTAKWWQKEHDTHLAVRSGAILGGLLSGGVANVPAGESKRSERALFEWVDSYFWQMVVTDLALVLRITAELAMKISQWVVRDTELEGCLTLRSCYDQRRLR